MRITGQAVRDYRKQVDRQADRAADYIGRAVGAYMARYPQAGTAQVRKFTSELMRDALPTFTDLAETLSCDFMEGVAEAHGWENVAPEVIGTTNYDLVDKRLHYLAGALADGDAAKYRADVMDVTRFYVERSAQDAMVENCGRAQLRYARVPSGFETCGFCFMLASRGFVYKSEVTAGRGHAFHPNCNCTIVPGAKGRTAIDGYDPAGMKERWDACAETVGSHDADAVMKEVETRDWHWLYTGEVPKVDYSAIPASQLNKDQKHTFEKDKHAAEVLAGNGVRVSMIDNPLAKGALGEPKFDYAINGSSFEAKCPEGNGYLAVAGNIAKADEKFRKLGKRSRIVISNLDSKMSDATFIKFFEEAKDDEQSDWSNIETLILVMKNGKIRHEI